MRFRRTESDDFLNTHMFERFTESARRALFFARYEVTQEVTVPLDVAESLRAIVRLLIKSWRSSSV
jgi:hypothetical protein